MELQKLNWKINIKNIEEANPSHFFKVFNSWVADSAEIFIDVADYSHVHDGPLTLLVGHFADFALDDSGRKLGLLYSMKREASGTNAEKLKKSLKSLLEGAARLEKDAVFGGKLSFDTNALELIINDRALAPNNDATLNAVKGEMTALLDVVYGANNYSFSRNPDPKQRFTVHIKSQKEESIAALLSRLS